MGRCKLLPLAIVLVLHSAFGDVSSNIFLSGVYKNSIDSHPISSEYDNSVSKNIFLDHAIFSRQAQPFSAPTYLPPKEFIKCGGGQQCVKKNVCNGGYFTNNPNGYIQNCEPDTDVCCTYRPPATTTTTERPYSPCGADSDCVSPNQCTRGTINVSNYAKTSSVDRCYAPKVCCRLPATALTPDGYVLTVPDVPFPQPPSKPPTYQPPSYQPPSYQPPAPKPPTYAPPAPKPPTYIPPAPKPPTYIPPAPPARPSYQPPAKPSYQPPVTPSYQPPARPSYQPPGTPATPSYQPPAPKPSAYIPPAPPATPSYQPPARPSYQPPAPKPPTYIPPAPPATPSYQPPARPSYQPPTYQPPAPPARPSYQPPSPPAPPARPSYQPPSTPEYQPPRPQGPQYIPPAPPSPPAYKPPSYTPPSSPARPPYQPPSPQAPQSPRPQPPRQQPPRPQQPRPQPPSVQPLRPQPPQTNPQGGYLPPRQPQQPQRPQPQRPQQPQPQRPQPSQPQQPDYPQSPEGSPSNQIPIRGEDILSEPIFPSRKPPVYENNLSPFAPQKCAAALVCTDVNYCDSKGTISTSPTNLSPQQAAYRVPLTDCLIEGSGAPGKCCRDSNYVDPWPVNPSGQCASRNRNTKPRGVTDEDTSFAEIPWQAMVLKESTKSLLCGGAIIGYAMVMTTASCLAGEPTKDILIKAGEWQLGSDDEPLPFQLVRATEVEVHPEYNPSTGENNLAIILLEKNLQTAVHVSPICISDQDPSPSERCIVTGWGKEALRIHQQGALMHQTPADAVSRSECGASATQVCARTKYDACDVDYGSALACGTGDSYKLKGIFMSEDQCGNSVATFTKPDIKWINTAFNNNNRALLVG